ncbi:hypothetical protein CA264_09925 [Pontibacter actiniarum]|uniref:Transcriptional regulator n=1 Tax=Pontibacter actiniarum TaxID=323450 RepID=A0A1X9YYJ2_9BACT|nr:hypothetical protein CA264_09925 [Pontibacter actiniarum]
MECPTQPLLWFFTAIRRDPRIGPSHIALYAALYRRWLEQAGTDPVLGYSHELMPAAKLCSSGTYHRVLRELHAYGYVRYVPSYNRLRPSQIFLHPESRGRK